MASNAGKRKPYQIERGEQASDIDAMFEQLYRRVQAVEDAAGGGAGHNILSATHADVTVAAAADGDILIRSGGKWIRLAKGTNLHFLQLIAGLPAWGVNGSLLEDLNAAELVGTVPVSSILHNFLDAVHQDTVASTPQLGDIVVAQDQGALDTGPYYLDGENLDYLPTSRDPTGMLYWLDGQGVAGLSDAGDIKWARKAIGQAGTVLTSDGQRVEWIDPTTITGSLGVGVYRSSDFSLADQTPTAVTFDTEIADDGAFWDSGAPTRLTVPTGGSGWYAISGTARWPSAVAAGLYLSIYVNGTKRIENGYGFINATAPYEEPHQVSAVLKLNAGDYVELYLEQQTNTGTSYTIQGGQANTSLAMARV